MGKKHQAKGNTNALLQPGVQVDPDEHLHCKNITISLCAEILMWLKIFVSVKTRAVKRNAFNYAINLAGVNAIKYFNAVNASLYLLTVCVDPIK